MILETKMDRFEEFKEFLYSLNRNSLILESIQKGFDFIFEGIADARYLNIIDNVPNPTIKHRRGDVSYGIKFWGVKGDTWRASQNFLEYLKSVPEYKIRKEPSGNFFDWFTENAELAERLQNDFNGVKQEYKNAITSASVSGESKPVEDDGIIHPPKALNPITVLLNGKEVTGYPVKFDYTDNKDQWKAQNDFLKKNGFGFVFNSKTWYTLYQEKQRKVTENFQIAWEEYKAYYKAEQEKVKASSAVDANINIPTPEGLEYLPYQKAGIKRAASQKRSLIADEMGLGKTMQAIGVAQLTKPKSVLIISPEGQMNTWEKEWKKWDTTGLTISQAVTKDTRDGSLPNSNVVIAGFTNVALAPDAFRSKKWDMLIIDESHKVIANEKKQQAIAILGERKWDKIEKQWNQIEKGIDADRIILLTGTPIPNKLEQLFPTLRLLDPDGLGKSVIAFKKRYMNEIGNAYTESGVSYYGSKNTDELQEKMRAAFMTRRMSADVLKELPPLSREMITIKADGEVGTLLSKEKKINDILRSGKQETTARKAAFTEGSRIRRELGEAKIPFIVKYAKEILSEKKKLVIMLHHNEVADKVERELSQYNPVKITGTVSKQERNANVDKFQEDPSVRVAIVSIETGGVGLTLTAADTMLFCEISFVPGANAQAEKRIHRIGQKNPVTIKYLLFDDSLDGRMLEINSDKAATQSKVLDADEMESMKNIDSIEAFESENDEVNDPKKKSKTTGTYNTKTGLYLPALKDDEKKTIIDAATYLADLDPDKASEINSVGYNKFHGDFGQKVATNGDNMKDAELWKALHMLYPYYRKQLAQFNDKLKSILERGESESIDPDVD